MSMHGVDVIVNGVHYQRQVPSNLTLLTFLREQLGLTGAKCGCETGECGACTVMMNGAPVNSCLVLAVEANGASVQTVEGLAQEGRLDPLQDAFIENTGTQCGFCTPGILIAARALLDRNPDPTDKEIREALRGNLCRCTGYVRIIDAVKTAAKSEA